jgi:hypothetical protein
VRCARYWIFREFTAVTDTDKNKEVQKSGRVVHACNPSTWEVEAFQKIMSSRPAWATIERACLFKKEEFHFGIMKQISP